MHQNYHSIFHRLDDVGRDDHAVMTFIEWMAAHPSNCIVAVIPAQLNENIARLLRSNPGLAVFQHGVCHESRTSNLYPDEFPSSVPIEKIKSSILGGKLLLEDRLGIQIAGYVPPWNRTSPQALASLEQLGFKFFSGHARFQHESRLIQLNVAVDTTESYQPLQPRNSESVIQEIDRFVRRQLPVGVMYHVNGLGEKALNPLRIVLNQCGKIPRAV